MVRPALLKIEATGMNVDDFDEKVYDYLDRRYGSCGGHRQQLYQAAFDLADQIVHGEGEALAHERRDARILRLAWEASKTGNLLCEAFADVLGNSRRVDRHIAKVIRLPYFLSPDEKEQSAKLKGARVYRGCTKSEAALSVKAKAGTCGLSWTLDPEVAGWFAGRIGQNGAVISGIVGSRGGAWLDTAESEVILPFGPDSITLIESPWVNWDEWSWERTVITPMQAQA